MTKMTKKKIPPMHVCCENGYTDEPHLHTDGKPSKAMKKDRNKKKSTKLTKKL